ncbi:MAG TPA: universal stress protein [Mucilaginibacter sp.]
MKTILVLTDFSINAEYAAFYTLKLAQNIKANLLLCNIYEVPQGERTLDSKSWPLRACEENSIQDLGALSAKLKSEIDQDDKSWFRPEVNQCSLEGAVIDRINEIAGKYDILMAVISKHNAGFLSTLISGNHTHDIIETAKFPVMVIPYQVRFKGFKKIAFATDLVHNGMDILHSLYEITKYFDSEILITHVANDQSAEIEKEHITKYFFTEGTAPAHYPKIYYRAIQNKSVVAGLDRLSVHTDIDLMVLVHRKRNIFQKLFDDSITHKLAVCTNKPLLIFPASDVKESLPVF